MPKIDLLPCPFCGGKAEFNEVQTSLSPVGWSHKVICPECYVILSETSLFKTKEEAAKAWNTRAFGLIQCSERIPKKDSEYLCVSNGELKILPYRNGEFYCACFDAVLRCCNSSVTHWMPLPEPPKEMNNAD